MNHSRLQVHGPVPEQSEWYRVVALLSVESKSFAISEIVLKKGESKCQRKK